MLFAGALTRGAVARMRLRPRDERAAGVGRQLAPKKKRLVEAREGWSSRHEGSPCSSSVLAASSSDSLEAARFGAIVLEQCGRGSTSCSLLQYRRVFWASQVQLFLQPRQEERYGQYTSNKVSFTADPLCSQRPTSLPTSPPSLPPPSPTHLSLRLHVSRAIQMPSGVQSGLRCQEETGS